MIPKRAIVAVRAHLVLPAIRVMKGIGQSCRTGHGGLFKYNKVCHGESGDSDLSLLS